jgi:heptosyltransferase-3
LIAIHPGSGSPRKNWPLERWRELCAWLTQEQKRELLIVTGEAEPPNLLGEFGHPARNLPLGALATQLRDCRLFIGHDSGVSHLAAAQGVRCALLFGPTDPAIWAPPGDHVTILRRGSELANIALKDVNRVVSANL